MRSSLYMILMWSMIVKVEGGPPCNLAQITPICYKDTKAKTQLGIFFEYIGKYGKTFSPEEISRIWNGGPNGPNKKSTLGYWRKVKHEMDRARQSNLRWSLSHVYKR